MVSGDVVVVVVVVLEDERVGGGEWMVGRIDIYRVDCVNAGAQKDPIDFRRCVNGNTIEGRDRASCSQWKTWGTHTAAWPGCLQPS